MILYTLDMSSSPGWPLCKEASTIGQWLGNNPAKFDPYRVNQLWNMVQQVLEGTYFHAFKVFIKMEPHKIAKANQGRWRLIMMSSLPVQVAWHMAIRHLERKIVSQTGHHPLRHGMCYYGGGWQRFHEENIQKSRIWAADKSGWDWNSPGWVYEACYRLRVALTFDSNERWEKVLRLLYDDAYVHSKFVLPSGKIVEQLVPGLMKSGLVSTITDNGISQVAEDVLACKRLGMPDSHLVSTGDDTLQRKPLNEQAYVSALSATGCVLKEFSENEEFMGFDIRRTGYYPKYTGKHLKNLLYQEDQYVSDSIDGYLRIYVFDEEMSEFFRIVGGLLGVEMKSRGYYRYFANNPDALETERYQVVFSDQVVDPWTTKGLC